MTWYKAQGSQYDVVIFVTPPETIWALTCQENYTVVSRPKKKCFLIGPLHAFDNEKVRSEAPKRVTLLEYLLPKTDSTSEELSKKQLNLIEHSIKTNNRKKISKELRFQVWCKHCDKDSMKGDCYVCGVVIHFQNFDVCHIQSVFEGGQNSLNNLVPGCHSCNLKMGTENLEDYKNRVTIEKDQEEDTNDYDEHELICILEFMEDVSRYFFGVTKLLEGLKGCSEKHAITHARHFGKFASTDKLLIKEMMNYLVKTNQLEMTERFFPDGRSYTTFVFV